VRLHTVVTDADLLGKLPRISSCYKGVWHLQSTAVDCGWYITHCLLCTLGLLTFPCRHDRGFIISELRKLSYPTLP